MLRISNHGFAVIGAQCKTPMTIARPEEIICSDSDSSLSIHVTQVTASDEAACRYIDSVAREAYISIDISAGSIDILQSAAGSGKTKSNIDLAQYLLRTQQAQTVLLLAFNRQAVLDGISRTQGEPRIHWKTLDSAIFELYKNELKDIECTDLDDVSSLCRMANRCLDYPVHTEDAEEFQESLIKACETGDPSLLYGDTLELFQKGLQGKWWCFSLLRIRAQTHPRWTDLFAEYKAVFVDEAQDINPALFALLKRLHPTKHMFYTMDAAQKLYSFMGCINITDYLEVDSYRFWRFYTTYRHGREICEFVNERCLPKCYTFPAENTPNTTIGYIADEAIVPGAHTYIISSWRNILEAADHHLNKNRKVRIDAEKRKELMIAVQSSNSKYEKTLFKRMHKEFIHDVLQRLQTEEQEDQDEVFLTTIHSFKGLESETIRVSRCVIECKKRKSEMFDDTKNKVYVAITRVKHSLWLPSKRVNKRKSW